MRYEKIGPAVAVIVSKGRSRGPAGIAAKSAGFGHIGKCSVAVIAIEHHAAHTSPQQIRPAVVVVVANGSAHRPAGIAYPCLLGDIGECSVVVVMKQGAPGL